jgi:hypothetical protein
LTIVSSLKAGVFASLQHAARSDKRGKLLSPDTTRLQKNDGKSNTGMAMRAFAAVCLALG